MDELKLFKKKMFGERALSFLVLIREGKDVILLGMQTDRCQRNHISYRGDFSIFRRDSFQGYLLTLKERFGWSIIPD